LFIVFVPRLSKEWRDLLFACNRLDMNTLSIAPLMAATLLFSLMPTRIRIKKFLPNRMYRVRKAHVGLQGARQFILFPPRLPPVFRIYSSL
jgi:hypothetical protein